MSDQWPSATLAEIATDVRNGIATKPEGDSGTRILRISAVRPMELRLDDLRYVASAPSEYELRENDLLFTRYSGTPEFVGACARVPQLTSPLVYPDKLIRVRVDPAKADAGFVEAAFASHEGRSQVRAALKTSAGQVGISGSSLKEILIPLPALDEQRRIVAKLDALRVRSRRAKEALDAVPALLDKLRQSILAAAFRGDLTADWREANPDVEPASELVKRILTERRKRWEEAELAKMTAKGKTPKDDKWKAKYVEPAPVDDSELPELPEGWCWAAVEQLTECLDGLRVPLKQADRRNRQGPFPYFGASGQIDSIDDYLFDGAFILLAEDGANLLSRNVPVAFDADGRFWVNNHAHVLRPLLERTFLREQLNGVDLSRRITGSAQPKLTQAAMNGIPIAVAPMMEQIELRRSLAQALASDDILQSALRNIEAQSELLEAAVLAAAFRGELLDCQSDGPRTVQEGQP